jgi:hypothetical protein
MPIFEQVILTPNRYHIGGGRFRDLTKDDLAEYVQGTQEILDSGIRISVPSEHPLPGTPEGAPIEEESPQFADAIRNAGWLKTIRQEKDGSVVAQYEITSSQYADAIRDGSIKYSSPELREGWLTGTGKKFGRCFTHFALTPKPRNDEQEPLEEVAQFSLAEIVPTSKTKQKVRAMLGSLGVKVPRGPIDLDSSELEQTADTLAKAVALSGVQFAEVAPKSKQGSDGPPQNPEQSQVDENPDMPTPTSNSGVNEAIIAHLSELGVELPSDFDLAEDFRVLLAALKTASAAQRKSEEEKQEDEKSTPNIEEEPMPAGSQFSEEVKQTIAKKDELLAKYQRNELKGAVESCRLPGAGRKLAEKLETVQFSDEGQEEPTLTITEVVALINEAIPETMTFAADEAQEAKPPEDMATPSDAELDEEINSFLGRTGYAKAVATTDQ